MKRETTIRAAVFAGLLIGVGLVFALAPETVGAQCSLCQTAVRAGGEQARRTMLTGMLVLLIPTVAIFCSIFVVIFRHRREDDSGEDKDGRR